MHQIYERRRISKVAIERDVMNYVVLVILLAVGIYNLSLSIRKMPTISQMYQKIFPTWFDIMVFVIGETGICIWKHYCPELDSSLMVWMAGFFGHVTFPNKERYKKGE